ATSKPYRFLSHILWLSARQFQPESTGAAGKGPKSRVDPPAPPHYRSRLILPVPYDRAGSPEMPHGLYASPSTRLDSFARIRQTPSAEPSGDGAGPDPRARPSANGGMRQGTRRDRRQPEGVVC